MRNPKLGARKTPHRFRPKTPESASPLGEGEKWRPALVRRAELTPANVNETQVADGLIAGDEAAVYGDAAYGTHARSARLRARGIQDQLMRRPSKHHPRLRPAARAAATPGSSACGGRWSMCSGR